VSREIYTGLSGASAIERQLEVLSNNIANSTTSGYRESRVAFRVDGEVETASGKTHAALGEVYASQQQGGAVEDGDPNHLMLEGDGWFVVQVGDEELLTRDGRFQRDTEGQLQTLDGYPVLGEGGPISIEEARFSVGDQGLVHGDESGEIDTIKRVSAELVEPVGGNLYRARSETTASTAIVKQGFLESSNVNPMRAMSELILAGRRFEAVQKAMQASDELDQRANRSGGRA
jgi:flagellar basal-body rod protein FlgF